MTVRSPLPRSTNKSPAHILLEIHMRELGYGNFVPEFKFHPKRRWRFDYLLGAPVREPRELWPLWGRIAVEIEGAIWTRGRHTRGSGYQKDLEKYREATALGYKVYRFSTQEVMDGTAKAFIKEHCQ